MSDEGLTEQEARELGRSIGRDQDRVSKAARGAILDTMSDEELKGVLERRKAVETREGEQNPPTDQA